MKFQQSKLISSFVITIFIATSSATAADIVYRKSNSKRISGEITKITNTEIVIKPSIESKPVVHVSANDIKEVRWNKESPELMLLRGAERKESYEKALKGYQTIYRQIGSSQKGLRTDLSFLIARVTAKLAKDNDKQLKEAITLMEKFRKTNSNHFRYYESLAILNRLYQKSHNPEKSLQISELIAKAPWREFKDSGKNEKANSLLKNGKADQALILFDEVIQEYRDDPENEQVLKASLGKAGCLIELDQYQKAEELIYQVLDNANPQRKRLFAETYLRQGELYRSQNRPKDAILAYLRIDLIFNKEKKAHEESLYWLSYLWKKVGNETRSLKNSEKLKSKYPESQWISKLN